VKIVQKSLDIWFVSLYNGYIKLSKREQMPDFRKWEDLTVAEQSMEEYFDYFKEVV